MYDKKEIFRLISGVCAIVLSCTVIIVSINALAGLADFFRHTGDNYGAWLSNSLIIFAQVRLMLFGLGSMPFAVLMCANKLPKMSAVAIIGLSGIHTVYFFSVIFSSPYFNIINLAFGIFGLMTIAFLIVYLAVNENAAEDIQGGTANGHSDTGYKKTFRLLSSIFAMAFVGLAIIESILMMLLFLEMDNDESVLYISMYLCILVFSLAMLTFSILQCLNKYPKGTSIANIVLAGIIALQGIALITIMQSVYALQDVLFCLAIIVLNSIFIALKNEDNNRQLKEVNYVR